MKKRKENVRKKEIRNHEHLQNYLKKLDFGTNKQKEKEEETRQKQEKRFKKNEE